MNNTVEIVGYRQYPHSMFYYAKYSLFIIFLLWLLGGCSNTLDTGTGEEDTFTIEIIFYLPSTSHVNLWVENSYNTKVATLVDEVKQTGSHSAKFEAVDSNGNNLPEGIYTYHIETENISHSRHFFLSYP